MEPILILEIRRQIHLSLGLSAEPAIKSFLERDGAAVPGMTGKCGNAVKGVQGCDNRHVEEETLVKAYLLAWNALVENRESLLEQWKQ